MGTEAPRKKPPAPPPAQTPTFPPPPPAYLTPTHHHEPAVVVYEEPPSRTLALTLNPLPLIWGRLSVNVEWLFLPHHSLIASPNLLISNVNRGGALGMAFGYAQQTSGGAGTELGYHFWWYSERTLRGPFFGPSFLGGFTTNATAGTTTNAQPYWGAALDIGDQEVLPGGFTAGAGLGVGYVRMADSSTFFPRLLAQLGWSF
jgi:hypothetical protein